MNGDGYTGTNVILNLKKEKFTYIGLKHNDFPNIGPYVFISQCKTFGHYELVIIQVNIRHHWILWTLLSVI